MSKVNTIAALVASSLVEIVLFPVPKDKRVEGGPTLTGTIKFKGEKVDKAPFQLAAFPAKSKKDDTEFFSLKVQTNDGKDSILVCYGAAFPRPKSENPKAPSYGIVLNLANDATLVGALWPQVPKDKESAIKKFLSGHAGPPDEEQAAKAKAAKEAKAAADAKKSGGKKAAAPEADDSMDDDIPF